MFQVDAVLIASEVVLRPSPTEIYNIILQNERNLLEQLKLFPRWMNGSCLECKPQTKTENDTFVNFTFFEDLMSIQVSQLEFSLFRKEDLRVDPLQIVNDTILTIQRTAHKLALEAWNYLQRWKKYSTLWSFDKNLAAEKYAATQPTLHQYDEKFSFYSNILEELMEMKSTYGLYSIRFVIIRGSLGCRSTYLVLIIVS